MFVKNKFTHLSRSQKTQKRKSPVEEVAVGNFLKLEIYLHVIQIGCELG